MPKTNFDFSGYATKNNLKCTDGRIILKDAFKDQSGMSVPLVWQHMHDDPTNVLGHVELENREDGVYGYGYLNETPQGQNAKLLIAHKDITALSIWANSLVEKSKAVAHGVIREVSLVLSGANPGAVIDNIAISHADGTVTNLDDEAIIYTGLDFELPESEEIVHAEGETKDETIGDVFETLDEKQKVAVYAIIGQLLGEGGDEEKEENLEQSAEDDSEETIQGDSTIMKKNVFDGSATGDTSVPRLTHEHFAEIVKTAQKVGSLKEAFLTHEVGQEFLAHVGTYGIGSDRANLELLFPDAQGVTKEPTWIARRMEWVSRVISGTKHVPFSRIKSLHADITADEARALGYVTGNLKVEEVFPILRRITTPHTIYKKQKLDRDDILDITDFDVVRWLKSEMRVMLDEEIARAVLIGDGRDPVTEVDDHIPTDKIRPVWGDDAVYCYHKQVASTQGTDDLIDDIITARIEYRGSGNPDMYLPPSFLTAMLLLKDGDGRRLYRSVAELAAELRVNSIIEVPLMENQVRTDTVDYNLMAIIVNLRDYTMGADRGGEINFFDDFDIDYNQYKYLLETRCSGALVVPKSAIVLEQAVI